MCYGHARPVAGTDSCERSITLSDVFVLQPGTAIGKHDLLYEIAFRLIDRLTERNFLALLPFYSSFEDLENLL